MIVSTGQQKIDLEKRLRAKTMEQMFLGSIQEGANCPPFVARAILDVAKSTFNLGDVGNDDFKKIKPGQMKVVGVPTSEPPGKPLRECRVAEAVITLDDGIEDQAVRIAGGKEGVTLLRRKRLLRITTEALEQNVLLTREDIAYRILNCGVRTVTRDVQFFGKQGIHVPLRGWCKDIGPTITHKTQVVEHFIKRIQPSEIGRRTYHSLKAVERYILHFAKVAHLTSQYKTSLSASEMAFLVGISERLVKEYQSLYQRYSNPTYKERLREILSLAQYPSRPPQDKKRGELL